MYPHDVACARLTCMRAVVAYITCVQDYGYPVQPISKLRVEHPVGVRHKANCHSHACGQHGGTQRQD